MKVEFMLEKQKKPTSEQGMKIIYGKAKRTGYRIRWFLILGLLITPVLLLSYHLFRDKVLTIAPGIVTYEPVKFSAPQNGIMKQVYVEKGQKVKQGDKLYRIQNKVLDSEITFLQNERIKLKKADQKNRDLNLDLYQQSITEAKGNLLNIAKIKNKYDKYSAQGSVSSADYAAILDIHHQAKKAYVQANIDYNRALTENQNTSLAGPLAEHLRALEKELNKKQSQRNRLTITSPFNGYILDSTANSGEHISEGDDLMLLAKKDEARIFAYLDPAHIDYATQGQKVTVLFPNHTRFKGTISSPTEIASKIPTTLAKPFEAQRALLKITVSLTEQPKKHDLIEGMPVEVIF